jgi:eukaryotic-like serine/threonine-protein kinase
MSEPPRAMHGTVNQNSEAASGPGPAHEASETRSTLGDHSPPARGAASDPEASGPESGETLSTLADTPDRAPEEILALTIADAGETTAPGDSSAQPVAFQLVPPEILPTIADLKHDDAHARPGEVAGYEILGELGRGAMGVVYKARQRGLKRIVALKMISAGGHHGPADVARFRSEAIAVADLQHPNIVQIYEVGEDHGHPYFSLEYVAGGSLAKKIAGTPLPPHEAARLVRALADGMEYAHQRGIIHRDLKPANVLLTEAGEPKVSDFGLVKRLEDDAGQTQSGSILGTPSYMAPEQAEGKNKEIGPRSDIYALGGILYEFLTGRPPFRAASVLDTLQQVRKEEPIPPSQFQPKVPRDLETICLKCLQKDPARRYVSAAALSEDLRRFLAGEPILARPVNRVEWLWRWCRRNPRVAALGAVVATLVVGWAATSTLLYRLARTNEQAAVANAASASQNAALAQHNADQARSKAEEALANAETARQNAERANANEARARNQEQAAKQIAQDAIVQMVHLGEQVMRRLRAKHDPARAEAEWLRLRDDVLTMLQKEMVPLAERIEGQHVSPFAFATLHQRLGDLLRRLGQIEDARREYQQGCDRLARVAHDQPNNDMARANLGVMLVRLGEMDLDQGGDAARARGEFDRAWKLQEEISLHPRSRSYSENDNHRILSGIAIKQGTAALALGHPALARDRFQHALALRLAWTESEPKNVSAESYKAEAEVWLGVAYSHLGEWQNARRHLEEGLEICTTLADQHPGDYSFKGDVASVYAELGAALVRSGQHNEAETALNQSLEFSRVVLVRNPEDAAQRLVTAGTSELLAALAEKRGKTAEAERLWRSALEIRTELAQLETQNVSAQAALALALAHSGRTSEALKKAEELLRTNADRPAVLLPLARCFAACASGAKSEGDEGRAQALALDALSAAVRVGFSAPIAIRTDPDLSQLLAEPAFKTLVEEMKP